MDPDDKELIARYLGGDDQAFEQLLKRYLSVVYNFIFQMTRDRAAVDDLTQETFIKVWKHLARFDRKKSFKAWIFTIAKNTTYDFLKKKRTLPFSYFDDGTGDNRWEVADEKIILPDELLKREDATRELDAALDRMPVLYRTLLSLVYREDFSLQEISEIFGEPYNTIKSRHNRALKRLKKEMLTDTASEGPAFS
jgi:RNA polymerase sigma-70 factor, ECF subfamily